MQNNFLRAIFMAIMLVLSWSSLHASWVYTETNTVANGVSKGSLTDGVWTFYAYREKGAVTELTVDASKGGVSIDPAAPAKIDFSEIEGGYKVVKFVGWRNSASPLCLYTTEFIAPHCTTLSGQDVFSGNLNLTKVEFCKDEPLSTAGSPDRCFKNCTNLVTFEPRRIKGVLGGDMFLNCSGLEGAFEVVDATTIVAFNGCSKLGEVTLRKVKTIGQSAFYGCTSLSNIVIGTPITHIKNYAFKDCKNLTTEIVQRLLSKDLTMWGNSATDRIGCFMNCTGLTGTLVIDLPNLVTNIIPVSCFNGCKSLERVEIKNEELVDIGSDSFSGIKTGAEVVMPKNVIKGVFGARAVWNKNEGYCVPYPKICLKGDVEAWLQKIKVNHYMIEKSGFEDSTWDQAEISGVYKPTYSDLITTMGKDTSMCEISQNNGETKVRVFDKRVVAFIYSRTNSQRVNGCWVIDDQMKGFSLIVR